MRLYEIKEWEDIVLFDDSTGYGGISYDGETLGNFVSECEISEDISVRELNEKLKNCGIKPLKLGGE